MLLAAEDDDEPERAPKRPKLGANGGGEPPKEEAAPPWLLPPPADAPGVDGLSAELLAFEAWASLSPAEAAARDGLVSRVATLAEASFGLRVAARAFGSHAAGLATFQSDTDVGLHGLPAGTSLRSLAQGLQRCGWAADVDFRSRARIPIVAARDRVTGCEARAFASQTRLFAALKDALTRFCAQFDVCVAAGSGASGVPTTCAVAAASASHAVFRPVLLFLKAALAEAGLNKPFTGGLGSFKLCALLASYLDEKRAEAEANDAAAKRRRPGGTSGNGSGSARDGSTPALLLPGPALLGFLRHVGRFDWSSSLEMGGVTADFGGVFAASAVGAWARDASRTLSSSPPSPSPHPPQPQRPPSRLAPLLSPRRLARARRAAAARAPQPPRADASILASPPPVARPTSIHAFDVDGTLLLAPGPAEGRARLAASRAPPPPPGARWYSHPASLHPSLRVPPGPAMAAYNAAFGDPSSLVCILSGRDEALAPHVLAALVAAGATLAPHEAWFAPPPPPRAPAASSAAADATLAVKLASLRQLIARHGDTLSAVVVWEDRAAQADAMQAELGGACAAQGVAFSVRRVGPAADGGGGATHTGGEEQRRNGSPRGGRRAAAVKGVSDGSSGSDGSGGGGGGGARRGGGGGGGKRPRRAAEPTFRPLSSSSSGFGGSSGDDAYHTARSSSSS